MTAITAVLSNTVWRLVCDRRPGPARHMGNAFFTDPDSAKPPTKATLLDSLKTRIDNSLYLSPYSDIVALLVFDHQMHMMNLLTRVGWEVRAAKLEHPATLPARLKKTAEEFVDYLLFADEAPLGGKVKGNSGFAEMFAAQGPRDKARAVIAGFQPPK